MIGNSLQIKDLISEMTRAKKDQTNDSSSEFTIKFLVASHLNLVLTLLYFARFASLRENAFESV